MDVNYNNYQNIKFIKSILLLKFKSKKRFYYIY